MSPGPVMAFGDAFGDISENHSPAVEHDQEIRCLMHMRQVVLDIDAGAPRSSASLRFHPEKRFGSAQGDPSCLLPQNNPHGKQRLGLVQHLDLALRQLLASRN